MPEPKRKKKTQPDARRMKFLSDFMSALDITVVDMAKKMKVSTVSVFHWFNENCDDIRLSQAMDAIEMYGYVLNISLTRPGDCVGPVMTDYQNLVENIDGTIRLKRMGFIFVALDRYDINIMDLVHRMGVQYSTWRYWCSTDNLMISRVFQIADALGLSVRFDIKKRQDNGHASEGRRCIVHISIDSSYPLEG